MVNGAWFRWPNVNTDCLRSCRVGDTWHKENRQDTRPQDCYSVRPASEAHTGYSGTLKLFHCKANTSFGHGTALLMSLHWLAPPWLCQGLGHLAHVEAATWTHLNSGILIYRLTDSHPENLVSMPHCRFLLISESPKDTWVTSLLQSWCYIC